jgi:hypothetical protein
MHFLHIALFSQFAVLHDIPDMARDNGLIAPKQFGDLRLGHPQRLAFVPDVEAQAFV